MSSPFTVPPRMTTTPASPFAAAAQSSRQTAPGFATSRAATTASSRGVSAAAAKRIDDLKAQTAALEALRPPQEASPAVASGALEPTRTAAIASVAPKAAPVSTPDASLQAASLPSFIPSAAGSVAAAAPAALKAPNINSLEAELTELCGTSMNGTIDKAWKHYASLAAAIEGVDPYSLDSARAIALAQYKALDAEQYTSLGADRLEVLRGKTDCSGEIHRAWEAYSTLETAYKAYEALDARSKSIVALLSQTPASAPAAEAEAEAEAEAPARRIRFADMAQVRICDETANLVPAHETVEVPVHDEKKAITKSSPVLQAPPEPAPSLWEKLRQGLDEMLNG